MDVPTSQRLSRLECLAPELLSKIALFVALVNGNQLGPPSCILPLTLTSRSLHRSISLSNNAHLLSDLFRTHFDEAAFARRARMKISTTALASEYRKRCETLRRIRAEDVSQTTVIEDLWTAFLMFNEHDERNVGHLIVWANLHRYLMRFFRSLALDVRNALNISMKESTALSLAIYLLCYISNKDILHEETSEERKYLIDILEVFVLYGFRLPSFYAPDNEFRVQAFHPQCSSRSQGSGYDARLFPLPKISCITHYAREINLRPPPISSCAFLALVARYEYALDDKGSQVIEASRPLDRAHANALGLTGATQADMIEIASRIRNKLPGVRPRGTDRFGHGCSRNHDEEWYQVTSCFYPGTSGLRSLSPKMPQGRVFVPGQLCGLWAGKFMVPERSSYRRLINPHPQSPVENVPMYQQAIYMRLREHHYLDDGTSSSCSTELDSDGLLGAWLPKNSVLSEDRENSHLELYQPISQSRRRYETYCLTEVGGVHYPGLVSNNSKQKPSGVADIVITGETDTNHAEAWGRFSFTGRVRLWDGLIALLRRPTNPEDASLGTWIFRGYITPSGVLIGRWRETATGMESPGWEGPFFLTKQTETFES
ncbi:hypothetical protein SCHPADRAFT_179228 [Schizopora paradoxa]|uniref:F-box domain-containing protein n=1 Tax=Schizopora paradoxa TaxID=27342 RepID=A0A0H2RZR9_9AGAM|nr:hypothetical protein SCHPADRAFT_179228 [Schizopora paradoxa]